MLKRALARVISRFWRTDLRQYDRLLAINHPRFTWMNYGMDLNDFSWLKPVDEEWKYQVGLAHFTLRGVVLDGKAVLDTGSGRGGNCSYMARYHRPARVVGIERHKKQVSWCRRRYAGEPIEFVCGDAQRLPFESGEFGVVTNIESAGHYRQRELFFQEVHRVLEKGGHFCHSTNYVHPLRVEEVMKRAGFEVMDRQDITDQVVQALTKNGANLQRMFDEIARGRKARKVAASLHVDLSHHIPRQMFSEHHRYMSWVLRRV